MLGSVQYKHRRLLFHFIQNIENFFSSTNPMRITFHLKWFALISVCNTIFGSFTISWQMYIRCVNGCHFSAPENAFRSTANALLAFSYATRRCVCRGCTNTSGCPSNHWRNVCHPTQTIPMVREISILRMFGWHLSR